MFFKNDSLIAFVFSRDLDTIMFFGGIGAVLLDKRIVPVTNTLPFPAFAIGGKILQQKIEG